MSESAFIDFGRGKEIAQSICQKLWYFSVLFRSVIVENNNKGKGRRIRIIRDKNCRDNC